MSNRLVAFAEVVRLPQDVAQLPSVPVSGYAAPLLAVYCTVKGVLAGSGPHSARLPGRSSSWPSFGKAVVLLYHADGRPPAAHVHHHDLCSNRLAARVCNKSGCILLLTASTSLCSSQDTHSLPAHLTGCCSAGKARRVTASSLLRSMRPATPR